MSKSSLSNLIDPKRVAEAAKDRKSREHAMLCGALGAIEKGGKAVGGDESTMQKAAHYGRVLSGIEKQELGEKHYGEIADMVKSFVQGPQEVPKHRRSSMKPSELAENLRRIASAIDNSKNPSKELVLKEIKRITSRLASSDPKGLADNVMDGYVERLKNLGDLNESSFHNVKLDVFGYLNKLAREVDSRENNKGLTINMSASDKAVEKGNPDLRSFSDKATSKEMSALLKAFSTKFTEIESSLV